MKPKAAPSSSSPITAALPLPPLPPSITSAGRSNCSSKRSSRTSASKPSSAPAPTLCRFRSGPRSSPCSCSSICNCAPASAGACPISPPCCASSCSSTAICSPGSISPFNLRLRWLPSPSRSLFLGQVTWTAEAPTSTHEPLPSARNAPIFFTPAPRFPLIWTAVVSVIRR